ncbi:MAG: M23 family metallopeptidase [Deltaproteobacteria bacterium]|jgi:murein DD-endopeptidase MepM/ murein hydrolase activator NlpD|nr:M23 family metallopeptidase [Deltaproteobacteria bacterium]
MMGAGNIILKLVPCLVTALTLSGCVGLFIDKYGHVSADSKPVGEDGRAVFMPPDAPSISQGFRPAPPGESVSGVHNGIDIFHASGTPVIAAASGTVISSYFEPFAGRRIKIDHGQDENGLYVRTGYFHLKKRLVKEGDKVIRGQQIGTLGMSGLLAGFPHLHFEVRVGEDPAKGHEFKPMNPHRFWVNGVGVITCFDSTKEWPDTPFQTTYPIPCRGIVWK